MVKFLKREVVLIFILTLMGASLRLYNLGGQGMWFDEMISLVASSGQWSRYFTQDAKAFEKGNDLEVMGFKDDLKETVSAQPIKVIRDIYYYEPSHPPLYYVVVNLFLALFGISDFTLRLPSALFSTLTIPFLFLLGKRLYSADLGLVTAGLFAFAPYQIYYGQEARMYSMMLFWAIVSTWLLVELSLRRNEDAYRSGQILWVPYIATVSIGIYTHYLFISIIVTQFLFVGVRHLRDKTFIVRWFIAVTVSLCVFSPWLFARFLYSPKSGVAWLQGPLPIGKLIQSSADGLVRFMWVEDLPPYNFFWLWLVLSFVGFLAVLRRMVLWLVPLWIIIPITIVLVIDTLLGTHAALFSRYFIISALGLYLLVALGLLGLPGRLLSRLLIMIVLLHLVVGGYWAAQGKIYRRSGFKEAGEQISKEFSPDNHVIMISPDPYYPWYDVMILAYYINQPAEITKVFTSDVTKIDLSSLSERLKLFDQVFIVVSVDPRHFDPQLVTERFSFLKVVEIHSYKGVSVFRYQRVV